MLAYGIDSGNEYRRVKQLEIKANNYADLQKASLLIEDALRTATFPGLPKNGLILIRRLELGKIGISNNSTLFSNRIDQRLLTLTPHAITLGHEEQPGASIVWFADTIQPYVLLAHLLAKGITPVSWYWPLAVQGWNPAADTTSALNQLLLSASNSVQPLLVVTTIIDRLVEDQTVNALMDKLSVAIAEQILENLNIDINHSQARDLGRKPIAREIILTQQWQQALQQWLPRLDENDSRAYLLALSAAINYDYPTAEFTIRKILQNAKADTSNAQALNNVDQYSNNELVGYRDITRPQNGHDEQSEKFNNNGDNAIEKPIVQPHEQHSLVDKKAMLTLFGVESAFAGLPMLINVLQRLRVEETLNRFPLLADMNLVNHVLWACVNKLAINPDNSVCDWLTARHKLPAGNRFCPFIVPASWLSLLFSRHRLDTLVSRRVVGNKHKQLLCDSSGSVILAIWQGKNPAAVSELMQGRTIKLMPPVKDKDDLQQIIATYVFAIKRYLRRYAKTGLRKTLEQKGNIAVTKTHLDISFPMQAVDINLRKAGLDIDPGWVPWLGKVVQYHYFERE